MINDTNFYTYAGSDYAGSELAFSSDSKYGPWIILYTTQTRGQERFARAVSIILVQRADPIRAAGPKFAV